MTCKNNRIIFFVLYFYLLLLCISGVGQWLVTFYLTFLTIICYTFDICCTYRIFTDVFTRWCLWLFWTLHMVRLNMYLIII